MTASSTGESGANLIFGDEPHRGPLISRRRDPGRARGGTFYRWYDRHSRGGPEALNDRSPRPDRVWNRIPDGVRQRIIQLALDEPALSPRELAVRSAGQSRRLSILAPADEVTRQLLQQCGISPARGAPWVSARGKMNGALLSQL